MSKRQPAVKLNTNITKSTSFSGQKDPTNARNSTDIAVTTKSIANQVNTEESPSGQGTEFKTLKTRELQLVAP